MADVRLYVATFGPTDYDDSIPIDDPDGLFAGQNFEGLTTNGQLSVSGTPTLGDHVITLNHVVRPFTIVTHTTTPVTLTLSDMRKIHLFNTVTDAVVNLPQMTTNYGEWVHIVRMMTTKKLTVELYSGETLGTLATCVECTESGRTGARICLDYVSSNQWTFNGSSFGVWKTR